MQDDTIVVPEQLSVSDLRTWLSSFGQANKQHYEQGMMLQNKQDDLRRRIETLESALGPTRSRSSTPEKRTWESPPKMTTSNVTTASPESRASLPKNDEACPSVNEEILHGDAEGGDLFSTMVNHEESPSSPAHFMENPYPTPTKVASVTATKLEETTIPVSPDFVLPPATPPRSSSAKSSGTNSSSSIYRFEAVRPSPRRSGKPRRSPRALLEPPKPRPMVVHGSNDNDWEDDWADDFSEPSFPLQNSRTRIVGMAPEEDWRNAVMGAAWVHHNLEEEDEENYNEDDNNDFLEETSLLDAASGRYSASRKSSTQAQSTNTSRDNSHGHHSGNHRIRFPLWLCHKRASSDETPYVSPPRPLTPSASSTTLPTSSSSSATSSVFPDGVLTKHTLDFLCRDDKESKLAGASTVGTMRAMHPDERRHPSSPARSHESLYNCSSSQCSTASGDAPSILEGAVDDHLQAVLDGNSHGNSHNSCLKVSSAIRHWGGRPKKPGKVEERRRQLQNALAAGHPASHVKRIQWHVCPKTGMYKKKILVEPSTTSTMGMRQRDSRKGMI